MAKVNVNFTADHADEFVNFTVLSRVCPMGLCAGLFTHLCRRDKFYNTLESYIKTIASWPNVECGSDKAKLVLSFL